MKTKLLIITSCLLILFIPFVEAQIKNEATVNVSVRGNCGMCKNTIEKAGNEKNVAKVDWNKESKIATINYDASKTNPNEILKRIAISGYDNEQFLAPDDAYAKLPACCQYDRDIRNSAPNHTQSKQGDSETTTKQETVLAVVYNHYFELKDALVKSESELANQHASLLLSSIEQVSMQTLTVNEHTVWMKVKKDLTSKTLQIKEANDINKQRDHFSGLSEILYQLRKVSTEITPTYYQHCPMANNGKGAHWMSQELAIKNPYYGSKMLTCGKTIETIQ